MFRSTVTAAARRASTTAAARRTATRFVHDYPSLRPKAIPLRLHRSAAVSWRRQVSNDTSQSAKQCPSCSATLPTSLPACPSCYSIQPLPPDTTFYNIMQIQDDMRFDIDEDLLKRNFRQIQRVIHPDKWSSKGPEAQALAAEMSSFVNEAYKTLLNPFSRAEYILRLEGIEIGESDSLQDQQLIMEIMELREALEEAEHQDAVDEIRTENADNMKSVIDQISTYVEGGNWDAVKSHAIKLKYMQSIDAAAEAWPNTVHDH